MINMTITINVSKEEIADVLRGLDVNPTEETINFVVKKGLINKVKCAFEEQVYDEMEFMLNECEEFNDIFHEQIAEQLEVEKFIVVDNETLEWEVLGLGEVRGVFLRHYKDDYTLTHWYSTTHNNNLLNNLQYINKTWFKTLEEAKRWIENETEKRARFFVVDNQDHDDTSYLTLEGIREKLLYHWEDSQEEYYYFSNASKEELLEGLDGIDFIWFDSEEEMNTYKQMESGDMQPQAKNFEEEQYLTDRQEELLNVFTRTYLMIEEEYNNDKNFAKKIDNNNYLLSCILRGRTTEEE